MYWERRLTHRVPDESTVFVTWSLAGSCLMAMDSQLDRTRSGPHWLLDPRIAAIFMEALRHGETVHGLYRTHAWVVMPNHVHLLLTPKDRLSVIVRWLKSATTNQANRVVGRTGSAFWNREYFDHWIRSAEDLAKAVSYVERNPVLAGLAASPEEWPWSSAAVQPQSFGGNGLRLRRGTPPLRPAAALPASFSTPLGLGSAIRPSNFLRMRLWTGRSNLRISRSAAGAIRTE